MTANAYRLAEHISQLAHAAQVTVQYRDGAAGRAWRRTKTVRLSPVRSSVTYAVALHELGHVLGAHSGNRLDKEWHAWQWARQHALVWDDRMTDKERRALASYIAWARRRESTSRRGAKFLPPPDHPVWAHC